MLAVSINAGDQISQGHTAACSYFLQSAPECVLKADTRLVSTTNN